MVMNSFSQDKEFELISILLKKLNIELNDIFVCEFGAWDGYRFSNVVSFGLENHCGVIFIEGDKNKFKTLKRNFDDKPYFYLVNSYVNSYGSNKIEDIIERLKNNKIHLTQDHAKPESPEYLMTQSMPFSLIPHHKIFLTYFEA